MTCRLDRLDRAYDHPSGAAPPGTPVCAPPREADKSAF
jgi:hypothetical protein